MEYGIIEPHCNNNKTNWKHAVLLKFLFLLFWWLSKVYTLSQSRMRSILFCHVTNLLHVGGLFLVWNVYLWAPNSTPAVWEPWVSKRVHSRGRTTSTNSQSMYEFNLTIFKNLQSSLNYEILVSEHTTIIENKNTNWEVP